MMRAPSASNSGARSRNPLPSAVQPDVKAFGYHQRTTQESRSSESETGLPCWSGSVKSGAGMPSVSTRRVYARGDAG